MAATSRRAYRRAMADTLPIGAHVREWRRRRRLSQLDLACNAEISTRHLSFIETGRAAPSREMVLRLAEQHDVPLRDRNTLLLAAGFAPAFRERAPDDPALLPARRGISVLLRAHEPYPALAIDRHGTLVEANRGVAALVAGVKGALLVPPVNVMRLGLHPDGVAPRIVNYAAWRKHRLQLQSASSADPELVTLLEEVSGYPEPRGARAVAAAGSDVAVPVCIATAIGLLSFLSTTMVFGTPIDITLSEIAIETFLPADTRTAELLPELLADVDRQAPQGAFRGTSSGTEPPQPPVNGA